MKLKLALSATAIAACFLLSGAAAAQAWVWVGTSTAYPNEGGKWEYGYTGATLMSDYTVGRCDGTTTVKKDNGIETGRSTSPNIAAGQKAASGIKTGNTSSVEGHYF